MNIQKYWDNYKASLYDWDKGVGNFIYFCPTFLCKKKTKLFLDCLILGISHYPSLRYTLVLLSVMWSPHQRGHSAADLSGVKDVGLLPSGNRVTPSPPPHCLQPTIIASLSSGSALFIITSNIPLSTCTAAERQLPSGDCNSTRECKGKWEESPTEAVAASAATRVIFTRVCSEWLWP